jgi:ubiquitin-protein ligase E3 C
VVEDGFNAVNSLGPLFRQRVQVRFIDDDTGEAEQGIDLGGPFKEFLESVCHEVFRPDYGLFKSTPNTALLYPCDSHIIPEFGALMQFVGRLVGKALYEGILLDVPFAPFFISKVLLSTPTCW